MLECFNVVPDVLKDLPCWLLWKYEQSASGKPSKVPYYVNGNRRSGTNGSEWDRKNLVSFADIRRHLSISRGFSGIGLALLPEFGITALDFDHCVDGLGVVAPEVMNLVDNTYSELSPSGRGVRAFVHGSLGNHKSFDDEVGFETFSSKGFVTVTGRALTKVRSVAVAKDELLVFCNTRFRKRVAAEDPPERLENTLDFCIPRKSVAAEDTLDGLETMMLYEPVCGLSEQELASALSALDPSMNYRNWIEVGMAIHHESGGAGFELWHDWSMGSQKYASREDLLKHWRSFADEGKRPITARSLLKMAKEARDCIDLQDFVGLNAVDVNAVDSVDLNIVKGDESRELARFTPIAVSDFLNTKPPSWLIKGVLPKAELAILYGESGAGKSFVALDMAAALCRGLDWRGLRTRCCRVVYVAAEGAGGFRNRLAAYACAHDLDWQNLPFAVVNDVPRLNEKEDALALCKAIIAHGGADVVFIDTLAQTTAGANENSGEDMGRFIAHCRGIYRATGALVVAIHHSGKDASRGARGWSGIRAAADAEIEVSRGDTGRMIRVTKQKDGEDGAQWGFALRVVPIGMDEDGDLIESCVCIDAPVPSATASNPFGKWEALIVGAFNALLDVSTVRIATRSVVDMATEMAEEDEDLFPPRNRENRLVRAVPSVAKKEGCPFTIEGEFLAVK